MDYNNTKVKGYYYNRETDFCTFHDEKNKTSYLINKSNVIGDFYKGCKGTIIEIDGGLKVLILEEKDGG